MNKQFINGLSKIVMCFALCGLTACNDGWEQDPLEGEDSTIKNGVPQGTDQKGTPPLRDVMRIDVDDTHSVIEGGRLKFTIGRRLLHKEFEFVELEIDDLEEKLEGAQFDPVTGEFEYEVPEHIVPAGQVVLAVSLPINLYAEYSGNLQKVTKEIIIYMVKGTGEIPAFEKFGSVPAKITEGERKDFEFFVRDSISSHGPTLYITNEYGEHFVRYKRTGKRVFNDPTLWKFSENTIDLTNEWGITDRQKTISFNVQVFNSMGIPSVTQKHNYTLYTQAAKPEFFVDDKLEFKVGETQTYSFTVADTRREGTVTAQFKENCVKLSGKSDCECKKSIQFKQPGQSVCRITWTPETEQSEKITILATTTVTASSDRPVANSTKTITLNAKDPSNLRTEYNPTQGEEK